MEHAEARYTLAQAEQMIAARDCDRFHHHEPSIWADEHESGGDSTCRCGLVHYMRVTTASDEQLAGLAPLTQEAS